MRRIILNLLQNDSERYNTNKIGENEIQLSHPTGVGHSKLHNESSVKPNLKKIDNKDLWLRLPKRATQVLHLCASFFICDLGHDQCPEFAEHHYAAVCTLVLTNFTIYDRK